MCDKCFGRMRALLDDAPDLLGRLRSLADPAKATPTDQFRSGGTMTEAAAPVGVDLLDAIATVSRVADWGWGLDLASVSNRVDTMRWLSAVVLDRHPATDGVREAWSVQDAVDRWGVERVDRNPAPVDDGTEDVELVAFPREEWGDPIISRRDAEVIAGSPSTLRRWVKAGEVSVVGTIWIASVRTKLYRRSEVEAARDAMRVRQQSTRYQAKEMSDG